MCHKKFVQNEICVNSLDFLLCRKWVYSSTTTNWLSCFLGWLVLVVRFACFFPPVFFLFVIAACYYSSGCSSAIFLRRCWESTLGTIVLCSCWSFGYWLGCGCPFSGWLDGRKCRVSRLCAQRNGTTIEKANGATKVNWTDCVWGTNKLWKIC